MYIYMCVCANALAHMLLSYHFGYYGIFSAGSVSPMYSFLGWQPMIDVIFPMFLLFLFSFNVVLGLLLLF